MAQGANDNGRPLPVAIDPRIEALRGLDPVQFVTDTFGPDGPFARGRADYEARPGQVELSQRVAAAFANGTSLMGEAGCGVGKSYAYLVPATFFAVQRKEDQVVVAAPTIALQEQLVKKDLPALQKLLPYPFTFALLKGKGNFLCRRRGGEWSERMDEALGESDGLFDRTSEAQRIEKLYRGLTVQDFRDFKAWIAKTETGDKSELTFEPHDELWREVCGSGEECSSCPRECFSRKHKEKAKVADVIVTNYHVLFSHLAIKAETGKNVILPQLQLVILDESHQTAEIARKFFGYELRVSSIMRQARFLEKESISEDLGLAIKGETASLFETLNDYCAERRNGNLHRQFKAEGAPLIGLFERAVDHWTAMCVEANKDLLALAGQGPTSDQEELRARKKARTHAKYCERALGSCEKIRWQLQDAVALAVDAGTESPRAYWIDGHDNREKARQWRLTDLTLCAQPVDVARYLRASLFQEARSVIMTSATLATSAGNFSFVQNETGFEGETLQVPSPFDFTRQACLVIPNKKEMPVPPGDPKFVEHTATLTRAIVERTRGRALLLYTSWRNLRGVRDLIQKGFPYPLLVQGNGPTQKLVQDFKDDVESCLMGVATLWTGLDVPGEACVCVVVDKLPFPPKDDPICDYLERNMGGMDYVFGNYMLPKALITLRQGVGRLIRSKTDYGVVVLLDHRIHHARYKGELLGSLPRFGTVWTSIDAIPPFLARAEVEFVQPVRAEAEEPKAAPAAEVVAPMSAALPIGDEFWGDEELPF